MQVQCDVCGRGYDDAECWTICPHGPLWAGLKEYCPKCDTVESVHGQCEHQVAEGRTSPVTDPVTENAFSAEASFSREYKDSSWYFFSSVVFTKAGPEIRVVLDRYGVGQKDVSGLSTAVELTWERWGSFRPARDSDLTYECEGDLLLTDGVEQIEWMGVSVRLYVLAVTGFSGAKVAEREIEGPAGLPVV